jgi:hypothetical protein
VRAAPAALCSRRPPPPWPPGRSARPACTPPETSLFRTCNTASPPYACSQVSAVVINHTQSIVCKQTHACMHVTSDDIWTGVCRGFRGARIGACFAAGARGSGAAPRAAAAPRRPAACPARAGSSPAAHVQRSFTM